MTLLRSPAVRRYCLALGCVGAGGGLTDATGSWWPLALGASAMVMATVHLVQTVRTRARERRGG